MSLLYQQPLNCKLCFCITSTSVPSLHILSEYRGFWVLQGMSFRVWGVGLRVSDDEGF